MNPAHIHLLLNHIPVLGTSFGIVLLIYAIVRKSDEAKRLSLLTFLLCGLITIPVFLTGEPAEGIIEKQIAVSEGVIDAHEDLAMVALVSVEILAVVSIVLLFIFRQANRYPAWSMIAVLLIAFITSGIMVRTANLGGQIHHTEITGTTADAGIELEDD